MMAPEKPLPQVPHGCSKDLRAALADLREAGPIRRVTVLGDLPVWVITRYEEVQAALIDERLIKDFRRLPHSVDIFAGRRYPEDATSAAGRHLLSLDPPEHTRLRRVLQAEFSPRKFKAFAPVIETSAERVLRPLIDRGQCDLVTEFAWPWLTEVMCRFIGVPAQEWDVVCQGGLALTGPLPPTHPRYRRATVDLDRLWRRLVAERAARPTDDLIGRLVSESRSTGNLSVREIVNTLELITGAYLLTTSSLIAHAAITVITCPVLAEALRKDRSVAEPVVEELLRLAPSFPLAQWRFAQQPMRLAGADMAQGDLVLLSVDSANRDPRAFGEPDQISIPPQGPPHLTFGRGHHYCLGAELARLEARTALLAFADLGPGIRLARPLAKLAWFETTLLRGLAEVPVTIDPPGTINGKGRLHEAGSAVRDRRSFPGAARPDV